MKPATFDYFAPTSLAETLDLLRQSGDDAKVLAGGQSLMPLMNMRLVRPNIIIDINRILGLDCISVGSQGGLVIGGLTRHSSVEKSPLVQETTPLLAAAMSAVGHFPIRNRGTVGGSIVHADPAAELPAICLTLDAELILESTAGQRVVRAEDFFLTILTTAIDPQELLTEIRIPQRWAEWRWGFEEVCRRHGDFALAGAFALLDLDDAGICNGSRITLFGVDGKPLRIHKAEESLLGERVNSHLLEKTARLVSEELEPHSDVHASATYRKEVGGVMARRALEAALSRVDGVKET